MEKIAKEKGCKAILKTTLGENESEKICSKITEKYSLTEFFEKIKENPKIAEEYFKKEDLEKIIKILESKKDKEKEIKQIFKLSNKSSNGAKIIKEIIQGACTGTSCNVKYIAAGKYLIIQKGDVFKKLKGEMNQVLTQIEKNARKSGSEFTIEKN